jgi:two-component system LytT family response regulator
MTAPLPLRVVIVDDEPLGRQRVADLLAAEPGVEIAGVADNGNAAVELIRRARPDLVFLDVQMPGLSGLDVARRLGDAMPPTIFVTAYDQHALKAFDLAAIDYLVKPFDDERFEQALKRARHTTGLEETRRVHQRMLELLQGTPSPQAEANPPVADVAFRSADGAPHAEAPIERIAVESRGKVKFVPVDDVDYIAASGPYAEIVTGTRRHLVREPMQTLEDRLDPNQFVRIHRSYIVRVDRIDTLLRGAGGDYEVQLKDGTRLRVSRSRREALEQKLGMQR